MKKLINDVEEDLRTMRVVRWSTEAVDREYYGLLLMGRPRRNIDW